MDKFSFLNALSAKDLEELYIKYRENPAKIEVNTWRDFFLGFDFAREKKLDSEHFLENFNEISENFSKLEKEFRILKLIEAYQKRGHLFADTNPIRPRRKHLPSLEIENFDLTNQDLDEVFYTTRLVLSAPSTLRELLAYLNEIYCSKVGIEYKHIEDSEKINWIENWLFKNRNTGSLFSNERKLDFFKKLNQATSFEEFLHAKFVGQKRFSLEGNESFIVLLSELIEYACKQEVEEFVFAMAHRGRLNVLHNFFDKPFSEICAEFSSSEYEENDFSGDVKYHLGASLFKKSKEAKKFKISLIPNPSHLEAVGPVAQGITRAQIENQYGENYNKVLPVLIHGDAAIAGQGVVYECAQLSKLEGYKVGGSIHIVLNNQLGFTTDYFDARSSVYSTDVAKIIEAPILHVNADELEEVVKAIYFAVDFRMKFSEDVFIDLLGYRKYGHNEGDEPRFTQAKLYKEISVHKNARDLYEEKLKRLKLVKEQQIEAIKKAYKGYLANEYEKSKSIKKITFPEFSLLNSNNKKNNFQHVNLSLDKLKEIGEKIFSPPEKKNIYQKTQKLLISRKELVVKSDKIDWGTAELLAYGSLIEEGYHIRISGQDAKRGTFSHRHLVVKSEEEEEFNLLDNLRNSDNKGKSNVYNSPLSEYGVLGFDYGYAFAAHSTLVIWEAQFGDFSNGAQILIDQYLSAAWDKWKIRNGLVLFLPHGYEGQGAEHSSARMERFLQLCAKNNMVVVNLTTPANFFHFLRRHTKSFLKKPAVVFTPKSLLRHSLCVSNLNELAQGDFREIIEEENGDELNSKITKVIFCSGKFYYNLWERKKESTSHHITLVRMEQLYPTNKEKIKEILDKYPKRNQLIWAQEEPENMGAWTYILSNFRELPWELISPKKSASPASGSYEAFIKMQKSVVDRCFS